MEEYEEAEYNQYSELEGRFLEYYKQKILPLLEEKEKIRLKCVAKFWKLVAIAWIIMPASILFASLCQLTAKTDILWNLVLITAVIFIYMLRAPFVEYRRRVKNDIMEDFIKFFNGFTYTHGKHMDKEHMEKSRIFPEYDEYEADDCFFGKYEDVNIGVYEQKLKEIRRGYRGRKYKVTVFEGIAVEMSMNKSFNGQTIAIKDAGILNYFKHFEGMERVKLEDVSFEKEFEVYSTNQIEARYLLTTSFMERVLQLKELYLGKTIEISFYDNHILLSIDTQEDMFEPCSFFKSNINQEKFLKVFDEFCTIFSIVDTLRLNQNTGL